MTAHPTLIHERVDAARSGGNPTVICRMPSGCAVLGDHKFLTGYSLLLPDPVVDHLTDLDDGGHSLAEELRIHPNPHRAVGDQPVLVTVTETVGDVTTTHHDVSLWYAFTTPIDTMIEPDPVEFADIRWWPIEQITHGPGTRFDPHLPRFLAKLVGGAA